MNVRDKNASDEDIFSRLFSLTEAGRLDWKQVYEHGGTDPVEGIKESTAPQGYMAFDEYFGFGRVAVEPEDPEEDIEHSVIHVSGNRLGVGEEKVESLIGVIEDYIDAVQAGEVPSMSDRVNRKIQKEVEPLRKDIRMLEDELAHKDKRIGRMLSVIENLTRPEEAPPMTAENFRTVAEQLDFEVMGTDENAPIKIDGDDLQMAIKSL